jgi:hypothetical protein
MCRFTPVLLALLLLPTGARAETFTANDGTVLFSLTRTRTTSPIDAELKVSASGVWAQTGIRRAKRHGSYQQREITVLNEPYDLKDSTGGQWRMWIRRAAGKNVEIELVRAQPTDFPDQIFEPASVIVLGANTQPGLPRLTLFSDGRYRLGANHGRYKRDESGVTFNGIAARWGRGAYTVDAEGLVFRFKRGPLTYEVRYVRVEDSDEEEDDEVMAEGRS